MKYCTPNRIQIGDIEAFKKMIEDAIQCKRISAKTEDHKQAKLGQANFSHNDRHYQCDKKIKNEFVD